MVHPTWTQARTGHLTEQRRKLPEARSVNPFRPGFDSSPLCPLALAHGDSDASDATRDAVVVTFRAFHQYLGVGVGEHLGYLLTGAWTVLVGIAVLGGDIVGARVGWVALLIGAGLVVASTEFLGPNEERGWKLAGMAVPLLYVTWSLWLVTLGLALIV
jgi:hypothetical protein